MKLTAHMACGDVSITLTCETDTTERLPDPAAWAAFCRETLALAAKPAPEPVESKPDPASGPCASPAERVCEALRDGRYGSWATWVEIANRTGLGSGTLDQALSELHVAGKICELNGFYRLRVR